MSITIKIMLSVVCYAIATELSVLAFCYFGVFSECTSDSYIGLFGFYCIFGAVTYFLCALFIFIINNIIAISDLFIFLIFLFTGPTLFITWLVVTNAASYDYPFTVNALPYSLGSAVMGHVFLVLKAKNYGEKHGRVQ